MAAGAAGPCDDRPPAGCCQRCGGAPGELPPFRAPAGTVWHSARMRALDDSLTESERRILEDVAQFGVHVLHVPGDGEGPGFSFSIGLWHSFGQSEVIVFGLPPEVAHELINAVADEAEDGHQFADGTRHDGLLEHYPVSFCAVPKSCYRDYLGTAIWAYEGDDFPAVQLVWPDKQGRWPWQEGVREGFRSGQPVLGRLEQGA